MVIRGSFLAELKRRHVYKVCAAYAVGGWLLVQIATQVFPFFDVPNAWVRFVVIAVVLGFPLAIALSWAFDLTPEGIVRTEDAASDASPPVTLPRNKRERRLNYVLGALLLVAAGYFVLDHILPKTRVPAVVAPDAAQRSNITNAEAPTGSSVAVLPFADMSEAGDQSYFADGISEELLNLLAQIPSLHVVGRTSSFSFKGKNASVGDIGKALNVKTVLEGGVRKSGDRLRVTAQLINVADGFQLWSQTYDRNQTDIFAVQDDIAGAVVDALKIKLLPAERPSSERQHVPDFETYDHYLLGRQLLIRDDPSQFPRAVEAFAQAVARDPEYAGAYAGLAMAESFASENQNDPALRAAARERAMVAAQKAVQLGPALGDAFAARGYLRASNQWDWNGALADTVRAVTLDPADARNQLRYGYLLATLGRLPEAAIALGNATTQDPLFPPGWNWLGRIKAAQGDFAASRLALNRALAIAPEFRASSIYLGVIAVLQGDAPGARRIFAELKSPFGLALANHDLGRQDEAKKDLNAAIAEYGNDAAYRIAVVYAWWGDIDTAFTWLDKAIANHDDGLQYVKYDPLLRSLRPDPRYRGLLKTMRLPE